MIRNGVLGLIFLATPVVAYAQSTDPILATELFNQGRDFLAAGELDKAHAKLSESARLDPKVGTLARLAECEEKLGRMAAARGHWQQSLNVARSQNDDRAAHVEQELTRVDAVVPKLRIVVTTEPEGLAIAIDGTRIGVGALGTPLPVEAGPHVVSVNATRKRLWSSTIETALDGKITDVQVPVLDDEPLPRVLITPSTGPARPAIENRSATPFRVVGASVGGAGLLAVGFGIAFAFDAQSKLDASNAGPNGCVVNDCPPPAAAIRLAARDSGTIATVFFVAGGVAFAAGAALFVLAPVFTTKKTSLRASPFGVDFESRF